MENWRFCAVAVLKEENYPQSDSWTSFSDIGRIYNGHKFTYDDYLQTEQSYVRLFVSMFEYLHAKRIKLIHLAFNEIVASQDCLYDEMLKSWYGKVFNNMSLSLENIQYVIPLILRENIWGVLYHKRTNTYVRFGYDYYVYVNSPRLFQLVDGKDCYNIDFVEMVHQNGLYLK